ncbi:MAG TPA: hypothetical protein VHR66_03160 [Gemmataceae bacterium]|jgi:hypothetical protein|nr:hypothetical protein [Gemmataceae bacterium]
MRLWILFGCGVLVLAGALWPSSKRTEQPGPAPTTPAIAVQTPAETPKPAPAPVIEVIDLSRAYEPVRETEEPTGQVNPASFIEQPKRIPAASSPTNPEGLYLFGVQIPVPSRFNLNGSGIDEDARFFLRDVSEKLATMPRVVHEKLMSFEPTKEPTMRTGTFSSGPGIEGIGAIKIAPRELLDVKPREVSGRFRWPPPSPLAWDSDGSDMDEKEITWPLDPLPTTYIPLLHESISYLVDNRVNSDKLFAVSSVVLPSRVPMTGLWVEKATALTRQIDVTPPLDLKPEVVPASFVVKSPDGCLLLCPPGLEGKCQRPYPLERIKVIPHEVVAIQERMSDFSPPPGELVFTPMSVPYAVGITQPIPPNASIQNGLLNFTPAGIETKLSIMPRVVK